jgi:transcriptional regulator with XRE-family HTH domain
MKFGDRIRLLRDEMNISRDDLANKLNISYSALSKYETNERFPRDEDFLNKIADFFDVSIDFLFGRSDMQKPDNNANEIVTKTFSLKESVTDLPQEALDQIDEYIRLMKLKYKDKK